MFTEKIPQTQYHCRRPVSPPWRFLARSRLPFAQPV